MTHQDIMVGGHVRVEAGNYFWGCLTNLTRGYIHY